MIIDFQKSLKISKFIQIFLINLIIIYLRLIYILRRNKNTIAFNIALSIQGFLFTLEHQVLPREQSYNVFFMTYVVIIIKLTWKSYIYIYIC